MVAFGALLIDLTFNKLAIDSNCAMAHIDCQQLSVDSIRICFTDLVLNILVWLSPFFLTYHLMLCLVLFFRVFYTHSLR